MKSNTVISRLNTNKNSCMIVNGEIYINGEPAPPFPKKIKKINLVQINDKIYLNGYEYVNGEWKKTLKSSLIYLTR